MVKVCYLCKKGEIVHDKKMSGLFCTGCGECFELGAFTDEIQYREDERGRYMAVGTTYNVEKGFVNSKFSNHAQFLSSVDNARTILKRYCDKLYISDSFAQISSGFYHQLLIKKFMNGRRLNVVLAACLYISVRSEGANVILLDISDVSEANVYDIGRYYFQVIRILHFNIQTVDPCEYTIRFVDMLNLGDRTLPQVKRTAINIRDTANRLVQRMKRDWIHFGRRPSGVCAAAVLVSARINNVRCAIKDVISIAKVCESTIRKRINEFIETPASKLTYKEFMSQDLDHEEDPPSFKISSSMKETVEANIDKVERYQEIIEEHLKDSRVKLRGVYAKFLKEILSAQETAEMEKKLKVPDDENEIIKEAIIDQNILAVNEKIVLKMNNEFKHRNENGGNPSSQEIEYWAEFRPSAKSLGLFKREKDDNELKTDYDDLLNKNLNDLDDEEIDAYLIADPDEVSQRQLEWNILNKDYIAVMEEKESLKRAQLEDDSKSTTSKTSSKQRKTKRRKNDIGNGIEASSASEAVEAACKANLIPLNGLNLKELFNEDANSPNDLPKSAFNELGDESTEQSDVAITFPTNNKEEAHFVDLYHSYALKSTSEKEPSNSIINETSSSSSSSSKLKTSVAIGKLLSSNSNQPIIEPELSLDNSSSNPSTKSSLPASKIDVEIQYSPKPLQPTTIPDAGEDDEEIIDDDDYFDDDEEDELNRIRQKYSMAGQDGHEDFDDIEDCGF